MNTVMVDFSDELFEYICIFDYFVRHVTEGFLKTRKT